MPTYTLCREYVVSQSVLGQFFEWVTTLGIEDRVRLDLNFRPGSSLDSTPPSPQADIMLDDVSSATRLSLPSQDFDNLKIAQNFRKGWVRVTKLPVRVENIFPCLKEKEFSPCDPMHK